MLRIMWDYGTGRLRATIIIWILSLRLTDWCVSSPGIKWFCVSCDSRRSGFLRLFYYPRLPGVPTSKFIFSFFFFSHKFWIVSEGISTHIRIWLCNKIRSQIFWVGLLWNCITFLTAYVAKMGSQAKHNSNMISKAELGKIGNSHT